MVRQPPGTVRPPAPVIEALGPISGTRGRVRVAAVKVLASTHRLEGFKRWRSPSYDTQLEQRGADSASRRIGSPTLEWTVVKGRGIVWSKPGGASTGVGSTSKRVYRAVRPGGMALESGRNKWLKLTLAMMSQGRREIWS
jgi:hypothetical protein